MKTYKVKDVKMWALCHKDSIQKLYFYKKELMLYDIKYLGKDWSIKRVLVKVIEDIK